MNKGFVTRIIEEPESDCLKENGRENREGKRLYQESRKNLQKRQNLKQLNSNITKWDGWMTISHGKKIFPN